MKRRSLLAGITAFCASAFGAEDSKSQDARAVQASIRNYYAVWEARDARRYRALLTDDYVLLENGVLMNVEEDVKMVPKTGTRTDRFDFRETKVVGDVAYAYWFLDSDMDDEEGPRKGRWLESGVLRRSDGGWKVALLHSTRIVKK